MLEELRARPRPARRDDAEGRRLGDAAAVQERHGVGSIPVVMFSGKVDERGRRRGGRARRAGLHRQAVRPAAADRADEAAAADDLIARPAGATALLRLAASPATITARLASRLIQMPIPRPAGGGNESGIEISRIRTKIVASEPSAITTRLSGTDGGSSMPNSRAAASTDQDEPDRRRRACRARPCASRSRRASGRRCSGRRTSR